MTESNVPATVPHDAPPTLHGPHEPIAGEPVLVAPVVEVGHTQPPPPVKHDSTVFAEEHRKSRSLKKQPSVPLPSLTETLVNWNRVDRVHKLLCPCISFVTSVILVATSGSFLFGLNTALLNTSQNIIASDLRWCGVHGWVECNKATWYKAFVSTAVFLGAAAGALTGGRFMNNGHRTILLATLVVFTVGVASSVMANGFTSLLWARLVVGYGVGVTSLVTPAYISEMAPKERRGTFGVCHQLVLVVGQLIAVFLGLAFTILPEQHGKDEVTMDQVNFTLPTFSRVWWRLMLGLGIIPVIIAAALFGPVFTFETPQYYVRKRDFESARELLRRIHGKHDVEPVIEELKEQATNDETGVSKPPLRTLLKKRGYTSALVIGIWISLFQQITGINAFIASSNKLFGDAGLALNKVTWASIGLSGVNLLCTFIPFFLVDKLGRRTLLIIGSMGMAAAVAPATVMYWIEWNRAEFSTALTILAIVGACLFVVFFAVAAGPITWLYLMEIFPMDMKAKASSICVAFNWVGGIIMVFGAGLLDSKIAYTVFFGCSILYVIFVLMFVRETKGRPMGSSPYVEDSTKPEIIGVDV